MAESLSFVGKVTGIEESVATAWRAVERKRYQLKPQLDSSRFGINGLTSDVNKFEKSLAFATNRVAGFAAAASVFYAIQRSFKAFVSTTIEVENSLARINVNLNRNSSGLKEFSHTLFNIARETGAAFSDVAKAAEDFARQGLSVAETAKRTRDALVLSRIAAIGATEATQDLTAAVNTFYKEALTTTDIVNRLAAVDTRFAVSSRDLGLAISRVGNSAQEAGVSFNQLLGIVTAVQQTTQRGGSVIGNSLKTIFTRIARPEVLDQLQQLGVATRDTNNQFLPAIDIIRNLAGRYDSLSQSQKSVLAEQVGGVYQINILKAAVADLNKQYSTYAQVVQVAGNAQNEAFEKNEQLNKTLQASLSATGNSIKELFATVGNQRATGLIKIVTDGIEGLRKYLSGDSGSELGQLLGDGIVKGLSNVLTGPALVASAFAIGRTLFKVFAGFAQNFRAELGLATVAEKRELVLKRINAVMQQANLEEQKQIASATGLLAQKEAILRVAERIAATEARQTANNVALAGSFVSPGVRAKVDPRLFKRAAEGYVPAVGAEQAAISQGVGGASPSAKPVVIPNFAFGGGKSGPLVANTSEYIVPNFANGGSAIFNPAMVRAYGLPAGARKVNAADGHIPNFAAGFRGTAGNSEILQYLRRGSASSPQFGGMYFAGADTRFAGAQGAGAAALFAMAQKAQGGSPVLGKQGYVLGVNPASYEKAQLGYMAKGGLAAKEIETIQRLSYTSGGDLKMGASRDFGRFSKLFTALYGNAAGGYVPNLAAAISREMSAGVSPSSIYVDTDARVRSSGNPMGLLVANRRDEPAGGFQGVNRVLSQGGNPQIAGAARGHIPNFADGELKSALEIALGRKANAPKTAYQAGLYRMGTIEQEMDKAMAQVFSRVAPAIKKAASTFNANTAISGYGSVVPYGPPPLTPQQQKMLDAPRQQRGKDFEKAQKEAEKNEALEKKLAEQKARELAEMNAILDRKAQSAQKRASLTATELALADKTAGAMNREKAAKIAEAQLRGKQRSEAQSARIITDYSGNFEQTTGYLFDRQQRAGFGDDYNKWLARKSGRKTPASVPRVAPTGPSFLSRTGNFLRNPTVGIGIGIGAPFLAGITDSLATKLPGGGAGGTVGGFAAGGLSGGLQGAGIGAIFGPLGIAIGAGAGALYGSLSKLSKSIDEAAEELGKQGDAERKRLDAVGEFVEIQQQYNDALNSGNLEAVKNISKNRDDYLRGLVEKSPEALSAINGAGPNGAADLGKRLSEEFAKNEIKRSGDLSVKKVTGKFFDPNEKEYAGAARGVAGIAASRGVNLSATSLDFSTGISGSVGERQTQRLARLQGVLDKVGIGEEATASNFDRLVTILQQAQTAYAKQIDGINKASQGFKEFEAATIDVIRSLRRAGVGDYRAQVAFQGRVDRRGISAGLAVNELDGLATSRQGIGLRGAVDVQKTLDDSQNQLRGIQQDLKENLRGILKTTSFTNLNQDQRDKAFSSDTSVDELSSIANAALPGNKEIQTLQEKYQDSVEKLNAATEESVKTIKFRTAQEQRVSEIVRRQTSFSGYSSEQGASAGANLAVFNPNTPGINPAARGRLQDRALLDVFNTSKGFGANTDAIQGLANGANARNNKSNLLDYSEKILRGTSMYRDKTFRLENGEISEKLIENGARGLSQSTDPRNRAIAKMLQDNLSAQRENITDAAGSGNRINGALNTKGIGESDALAKKQLEAAKILQDSLTAFGKKQTDFTYTLNSRVQVAIENADQFYSKDQATQFQQRIETQIGSLIQEVFKLKGAPIPPTTRPGQ